MQVPVNIAAVHVFGEEGDLRGRLVTGKNKPPLRRPVTLISYSIGADVRVWEKKGKYQWEAEPSRSRNYTAVWAVDGDDTFDAQLFDGKHRRATKVPEGTEFKLEPLPLRHCYIDRRTNQEIPKPTPSCSSAGTREWFEDFPHPGCALTSSLCER